MSAFSPPTYYFSNIIFNSSFFVTTSSSVSGNYVEYPTAQGNTTVQTQTVNGSLYVSTDGIDGIYDSGLGTNGPLNLGPNSSVNLGNPTGTLQAKNTLNVTGNVYASDGIFDTADTSATAQFGGINSQVVTIGALGSFGAITNIYGGTQMVIKNYDDDGNSDMTISATNIQISEAGQNIFVGVISGDSNVNIIANNPYIGKLGALGGYTTIYDSLHITGATTIPFSFESATNILLKINNSTGTSGQVLTSGGATGDLSWTTVAGGSSIQNGETGVLSATSGTVTYSSTFATKPKVNLSLNTNGTTVFIPIGVFSHQTSGSVYTGFTWVSASTSGTATITWYATL